MLILAMLLVGIVFVPAASAKIEKTNANKSSDSEVETYGIESLTPEKGRSQIKNEQKNLINFLKDAESSKKAQKSNPSKLLMLLQLM